MYTLDYAKVGANIQKLLIQNNMTQQNLADALQISKQVMSKIINGNKAINITELARIAEVLNVTADELLKVSHTVTSEESLSFMGDIHDKETLEKIQSIRIAIDEIHMLEELLND